MAFGTTLLVLTVSLHGSRHQAKEWPSLPFEQGVVIVHEARQFVNFLFVTGIELLQLPQVGILRIYKRPSIDAETEKCEDDALAGQIGIPKIVEDICIREEGKFVGEQIL
jgi:hypothetical protein